jgi:low molecular weight protein-tyrosine phosphatase
MSVKILFVCMGNICRSPTAEGVFRKLVRQEPQLEYVKVDSCGTIGYHVGEASDPRSVAAAKKRGYDLSEIRARQLSKQDLIDSEQILVMDNDNYQNTVVLADDDPTIIEKVELFLDYAKNSTLREVPDPYYGGAKGFDQVIDLVEDASFGLIEKLKS